MKYKSMLDVIDLGKIKSAEMKASAMESSELFVRAKALLLKRAPDLLLASLMLIVFSPLLFLIMLAIKISSSGPVLHTQIILKTIPVMLKGEGY